jgi:hypothetical protein
MQSNFAASLPIPDIDLIWPQGMDVRLREDCADGKYRSGATLAFDAVTNVHQDGLAACLCSQRTAGTMSNSNHMILSTNVTISVLPSFPGREVQPGQEELAVLGIPQVADIRYHD